MPYDVVFFPESVTHVEQLEEYLASRFAAGSAERYVRRLIAACLSLADAPHRGTKRDDLAPGIRTTGFEHRVTMYFKIVETQIVILGLFYGGRSFPSSGKE